MTTPMRIAVLTLGTVVWMAVIGSLSGVVPWGTHPEMTFSLGMTLGLAAAALLPGLAVGLLILFVSRKLDNAMRWWALTTSLLAIFLALGCFALEDTSFLYR